MSSFLSTFFSTLGRPKPLCWPELGWKATNLLLTSSSRGKNGGYFTMFLEKISAPIKQYPISYKLAQQLAFPDMMTSPKEVVKLKKENCAIFRCLRTDSKSFAKESPTDCHLPWCKTIYFSCRAITMKINKKNLINHNKFSHWRRCRYFYWIPLNYNYKNTYKRDSEF